MTSAFASFRWLATLLLTLALFHSSCKGPEQAPTVEVAKAPSHLYLISYANSFVGALRAGGTAAGAFEIDRQASADGLYHLRIEWMENEALKALDLSYEGRDAELKPVSCRIGDDEEVPRNSRLAVQLAACHKVADLAARIELGGEPNLPTTELLIDFSAGGPAGKVWNRYVRFSDLAIREEFSDLEIGENVPDSFDLGLERDQFIGISSRRERNLMRLGTGSEQQMQRLAQVIDWKNTGDLTREFVALVEAVGIQIDKDSHVGYWSPLFNVALRAGTVFAVRAPTGSAPAGLLYVQESNRDMARLLVVRAPLGKDHGASQNLRRY
ncbi:MAG: hypothetical protein ACI9F9_002476 [Candidatus Paceibacteria bacterium]|jgi:hypothetical protein